MRVYIPLTPSSLPGLTVSLDYHRHRGASGCCGGGGSGVVVSCTFQFIIHLAIRRAPSRAAPKKNFHFSLFVFPITFDFFAPLVAAAAAEADHSATFSSIPIKRIPEKLERERECHVECPI